MHGRGFTLIELLVVVSIISILSLIAMPNATLALTRAKISRVRNDMRVTAGSLEIYALDNNTYPRSLAQALKSRYNTDNKDIFQGEFHYETPDSLYQLKYIDDKLETHFAPELMGSWLLASVGPDKDWWNGTANVSQSGANTNGLKSDGGDEPLCFCATGPYRDYDATNGTLSLGNVFRTSKNPELLGTREKLYENVVLCITPGEE